MDLPNLSTHEARVLGSLIEKDLATPEYYPLSLNALVNACNQINNRQPVMTLVESEVKAAFESLRDKRLAVVVSGGDNRVLKFAHRAGDYLELARPELSLMCELLLRGPQTPGELRGRAARMHAFADIQDVVTRLGALATRTPALVVMLARQPGSRESRYAHLLSGPVEAAAPEHSAAAPGVARVSRLVPDQPSPDLLARVSQLETEVAALKTELAELKAKVGPNPG